MYFQQICRLFKHMFMSQPCSIFTPGNLIARSRQNTTRSRHKPPDLGLILPFTAQSHPPFLVFFDGSPTFAACYKIQLQSWVPVRVWQDLPNRTMRQVQKWPWFITKIKIFNYMHILSGSYLNFQRFRRIRLWFCEVNFSISSAKYKTPGHP